MKRNEMIIEDDVSILAHNPWSRRVQGAPGVEVDEGRIERYNAESFSVFNQAFELTVPEKNSPKLPSS